ncbi:hypothetical protein [Metapseudomonas otitidis]|uniref:hypothetical protein n=1 Tax=Metapseudomonas otitidis TaxID=319939 RepID=UPI0013F59C7E|nr:hypothetical protein [Pseudomonas otitidis]
MNRPHPRLALLDQGLLVALAVFLLMRVEHPLRSALKAREHLPALPAHIEVVPTPAADQRPATPPADDLHTVAQQRFLEPTQQPRWVF